MIKKTYLLVLFSFIFSSTIAQRDSLTGRVEGYLTIEQEVAPFYSILLYDGNNQFVKGAITDSLGYFKLKNLKLLKYLLTARAVGMKEQIIAKFQLTTQMESKDLGVINIDDSLTQELDEVIVMAKAPLLRRTNDKIVMTIANSILAEGNNIFDMLNYIPSVQVGPNGEITVNRQGGVIIYIDGKSFQRVQEATEILENIDPKSIGKIEVYSNPPARFNAEGSSVINVITVKKKKISNISGAFGHSFYQFDSEIGDAYNESLRTNLYYNFGKLQTHGQLSFREALDAQVSRNENNYLDSGYSVLEDGNFESLSRSLQYGAGIQYEINKKQQISVDLKGLTSLGDNIPTKTIYKQNVLFNNEILQDSSSSSMNNLLRQYNNNSVGISYWYANEDQDTQRDIQFIYSIRGINNFRTINSTVLAPQLSQINRDNNYKSVVGLINNSQSLTKTINTKYGLNLTNFTFEESLLQNSNLTTFNYSESIIGAYVEFSGNIKSVNWQTGIRYEGTKWEAFAPEISSKLENRYSNLFPSFSVSVPIDSTGTSIGITYSRRISRPSVSELNPNLRINNQFSTQSGNGSNLLPRLYDNVELNFSSGNFFWSSWYRRTGNQRAYVPKSIDGLNVDYEILSVDNALSIGTQFSYRKNIGPWNPSLDFSIFHDTESLIDQSSVGSTGYVIFIDNNLKLSQNFTAAITYLYSSKLVTGYTQVSAFSSSNIAFQWIPKSKNFTVGLRVNDIFNTNTFSFVSQYPGLKTENAVLSGSREIVASFTYRFKMGEDFKEKKSKNDSENSRVN